MPWPNATNYFEAVQNPAVNFADAELRQGEPAANKMGLPVLYSGNFAAVFQLRCPGNQRWGVKCFTREVPGLQQRYQALSTYLHQAKLPFLVDFQYLEQGIQVGGKWYAVVKIRWIEGQTLNGFVETYLHQPKNLDRLARIWILLAQGLRRGGIAHGDLQHGNVLLIPGRKADALALRLIDYDGMFVPALAQQPPVERGHPNFQHPQRQRDGTYDAGIDYFSHLAIYTALRSLQFAGKALWKPAYDDGENLLFHDRDFSEPANSELFRELWQLGDPAVRTLAGQLMLAALGPLDQVPFLPELIKQSNVKPLTAEQTRKLAEAVPFTAAGGLSTPGHTVRKPRRVLAGLAALLLVGGIVTPLVLLGKNDPATNRPEATGDALPGSAKEIAPTIVFLADLAEKDVNVPKNHFAKNGEQAPAAVKNLFGRFTAPHGLALTLPAKPVELSWTYVLGKQYRQFQAEVAADAAGGKPLATAVTFIVSGDGRVLWESKPILKLGDRQDVNKGVSDVGSLELRVRCTGRHTANSHAVWIEPRLTK